MPEPAQFNPEPTVRVLRVGLEQSPVLVVDRALLNPEALVAQACREVFAPPKNTYYPGLNADLDDGIILGTVDVLRTALAQVFGLPTEMRLTCTGYYGLMCTPASELNAGQVVPHTDTLFGDNLAILIYLCPLGFEGTAFYRHKATGFETLSEDRKAAVGAAIERERPVLAQMPPAYADSGEPFFEQIGQVEAVFNRLVVYRSNLFHSALAEGPLSADPVTGRLTANIFVRPKPTP